MDFGILRDAAYGRGGYTSLANAASRHIPSRGGVYLMETLMEGVSRLKPVIVVSNEKFNEGPCAFICPLTIDAKEPSPNVFKTWATGQESNAVVENLKKVDKARLVEYIGQLSTVEQQSCIDSICSLFGIDTLQLPEALRDPVVKPDPEKDKQIDCLKSDLQTERRKVEDLQREIEFHKQQYDSLLNRILRKADD